MPTTKAAARSERTHFQSRAVSLDSLFSSSEIFQQISGFLRCHRRQQPFGIAEERIRGWI